MTTFELSTRHPLGCREGVSTLAAEPECELAVVPTTARLDGFGSDGLQREEAENPARVTRTAQ
jgi:hypothetical protein